MVQILEPEPDGTPVTEVRSRTRTRRRCRIVLGSVGQLAGGAALLAPDEATSFRRSRHRRPKTMGYANIGTPMTSPLPGECCGACDCVSSRSAGFALGASRVL